MNKITRNQWLQIMKRDWQQGEHIAIIGQTGSGKTRLASELIGIRTYVCVIAVKSYDDMIERFKQQRYKVIKRWPPEYPTKHVILWIKPDSIFGDEKQYKEIARALNSIYKDGGWCVYFDELGYIGGHLGLMHPIVVMLNQGRSSGISVVSSMTRPRSVIARIPLESLNQCRYICVFRYDDEREIKAVASIVGVSHKDMLYYNQMLQEHEFLVFGKRTMYHVSS